ncbi:hypothetical protein R5R35_013235 [Gryllus longicercus]|uniref:Angiotensin-converting enzyme n=1 Tax=Gryllus longicercus TaxID=2509291 RepID=A0AAN9Z9S3_9ORTH
MEVSPALVAMLVAMVLLPVAPTPAPTPTPAPSAEEMAGKQFLEDFTRGMATLLNRYKLASWAYASNLTDHNMQLQLQAAVEMATYQKQQWQQLVQFPWRSFQNRDTRRQFEVIADLGMATLPPERFQQLGRLIGQMQGTYSTAKVCDYHNRTKCNLSLEPELVQLLAHSGDADELRHAWVEWRRASGEKVRGLFEQYVAISNEAAALNNYTDLSGLWLKAYETPNFREELQRLWEQMQPLYQQLHAYVRRHLRMRYGDAEVTQQGPIPAHLLGNMWSQTWEGIYQFSKPFPNAQATDATPKMQEQNYTPLRMFRLAEEFFTSLNLSAMPRVFWERSIIEKPADREIVCHASAWDFGDGQDFRIKQCTRVDMKDLYVVHHEMGHVQYFLQYKDQPLIFRRGANPGFHEAVGDVMALSVSTPKHLRKVGLLGAGDASQSSQTALNHLYHTALQKVAFLPFGYLMDLWRWDVFSGRIAPSEYNCRWWRLREEYQGLEPPVDRTEEDFDPGAKYHIISSVPYIRYFVSSVLQFQIHRALCLEAGEFDPNDANKPLHNCDIHGSVAAGEKLKAMLRLGNSRPWPEALEAVTGSRHMDASGLLDYFRPLKQWLEEENQRNGENVGWVPSTRVCVATREELAILRSRNSTDSAFTRTASTEP